uniref:Nematode cuticle collagen N-terminal domain-containing protein n=1 Tax=Panagrellus redivivus TaxID=6233 RepID=A0A7E4VY74_PANRE
MADPMLHYDKPSRSLFSNVLIVMILILVLILACLVIVGTVIRQIRENKRRRIAETEMRVWEAVLAAAAAHAEQNDENDRPRYIVIPQICTCEARLDP